MKITKAADVRPAGTPTPAQLEQINRQTKAALTAEQVYLFSVRLCDDQPDRDGERFDTAALPELARLFIGKPGIVDHNWSAEKQVARIFHTEVVRDGAVTWLRGWAYLLRTEKNRELIAELEGGIRREVSIACAMKRTVCSLCGADYGACEHRKGQDGCVAVLCDPADAFEFSFVAVPAQREAGVLKGMKGGESMELGEYIRLKGTPEQQQAMAELQQYAELGRRYADGLRAEVVRLGLALELGLSRETLTGFAGRLEGEELEQWHTAFTQKAAELYPPRTQLPRAGQAADCGAGDDFMI